MGQIKPKYSGIEDRLEALQGTLYALRKVSDIPSADPRTLLAMHDELLWHGQWFEELSMNNARRGQRVELYERIAMAFRYETRQVDLSFLPDDFLMEAMKPSGDICLPGEFDDIVGDGHRG